MMIHEKWWLMALFYTKLLATTIGKMCLESEHPWKISPIFVAMEVNVVRENQRTPRLIDGISDVHFPQISKYAM